MPGRQMPLRKRRPAAQARVRSDGQNWWSLSHLRRPPPRGPRFRGTVVNYVHIQCLQRAEITLAAHLFGELSLVIGWKMTRFAQTVNARYNLRYPALSLHARFQPHPQSEHDLFVEPIPAGQRRGFPRRHPRACEYEDSALPRELVESVAHCFFPYSPLLSKPVDLYIPLFNSSSPTPSRRQSSGFDGTTRKHQLEKIFRKGSGFFPLPCEQGGPCLLPGRSSRRRRGFRYTCVMIE